MRRLGDYLSNSTAVALALASAPTTAMACPLCYGSLAPRVLHAYYLSAALLSVLPFVVVGTLALIAVRAVRRARESEQAAQPEPAPETV